jgi:phage gpG-like protein
LTLAARRLKGFGGTKSLLVRGDLRNSISVITDGDEVFVGVLRSAKGSTGESLADVAQIQEFGGPPVIIPITPKMRRFLAVLFKRAGGRASRGSGRGVVVTQVPARPFLRPAFEKFRAGAGRRLLERVGRHLAGD